jgi:hypothetical protein
MIPTTTRILALIAALVLAPALARADEPTYPTGSRIGLVPPPGMTPSQNFFGFEDAEHNAGIVAVALPPEAFADLDKSFTPEALRKQGVKVEKREPVTVATGKAFLVIGQQEVDKVKMRKWLLVASSPQLTAMVTAQIPEPARARYPDDVVRAALTSVVVRASVPVEEQLKLLPFQVSELANFRVAGVVPGRAVILSDATPDPSGAGGMPAVAVAALEPHIFIAVAPGGPPQASERDNFARDAFATIPNIKEVHVTTSEPMRITGVQGHQIIADAKDATGATALTLVQWLRFGGGGYLQMVGIARAEAWREAYPRFRSVRDGIDTR